MRLASNFSTVIAVLAAICSLEQIAFSQTDSELEASFKKFIKLDKAVKWAEIDTNLDGTISHEEKTLYIQRRSISTLNSETNTTVTPAQQKLYHLGRATFKELDRDKNADVSAIELQKYIGKKLIYTNDPPLFEFVNQYESWDPEPQKVGFLGLGLRIRKEYGIDQFASEYEDTEKSAADFKSASPAIFSYTGNIKGSDDVWGAVGTVARPFKVYPDDPEGVGQKLSSDYTLARLYVLPAISFNRLTGSFDPTKLEEADSLSFRIGLAAGVDKDGGDIAPMFPFSSHSVTASLRYDTDFGGHLSSLAGELDWQPIQLKPLSIGGAFKRLRPLPIFDYRTDIVLHLEAGRIFDAGGNASLTEGDSFFRWGPKAKLTLAPSQVVKDNLGGFGEFLYKRFQFFGNYTYQWGLDGTPVSTYLLETGGRISLNDLDQIVLEASYVKGETVITFVEVEYFQLSLGLKF